MTIKPTIFIVTDIETTLEKRIAFDIAWKGIDRTGKVYCTGSFIVLEAFKYDVPFFKEKLGFYFDDTYSHLIEPLPMQEIRDLYNTDIAVLLSEGHRVIFAAFNGGFDARYLGETTNYILKQRFLDIPIPMICIWNYWALSCPLNYKAKFSPSGLYYSTKAEDVYRFEFNEPDFIERHIAWHDVLIESEILLKVLRRKKKLPIMKTIKELSSPEPWKIANERAGIPIKHNHIKVTNSHGLF
jgi:hypothetical protein